MYKLLFFLHKSDDEQLLQHFRNYTINLLSKISDKEVKLAEVESNLLLDTKYSHYCEITFKSKESMDKLMNSKTGKELNKSLMDFHNYITVIAVNYGDKK